jgi:hypothetical protein
MMGICASGRREVEPDTRWSFFCLHSSVDHAKIDENKVFFRWSGSTNRRYVNSIDLAKKPTKINRRTEAAGFPVVFALVSTFVNMVCFDVTNTCTNVTVPFDHLFLYENLY